MRPSMVLETAVELIGYQEPFMITGKPGLGKTDIMKEAAKRAKTDIYICHPVVDSPIDYKGMPARTEDGAEFIPFGDLRRMIDAKKPLLVFADDLGQAGQSVQAAWMQLLLGRTINGKPISKHVTFAAATNDKTHQAGVTGILEPVKSRFITIINMEANLRDWEIWAIEHGMPQQLRAFIRYRPNLLDDFKPSADMVNSPTPRTVANCGRLMLMDFDEESRHELYMGAAGEGFANELIAFLEVYTTLPDPQLVLDNPNDAILPTNVAARYALTVAVAELVTKDLMPNLTRLTDRMEEEFDSAEFAVLCMLTATQRDENLKDTNQFIKWMSTHNDMLF